MRQKANSMDAEENAGVLTVTIQLKKIQEMYALFGECKNKTARCRECSNFRRYRFRRRTVSKCVVYGESNSQATDWNGRKLACGMFNTEYNGTPIYKRHVVRHEPEDNQMSLFEVL